MGKFSLAKIYAHTVLSVQPPTLHPPPCLLLHGLMHTQHTTHGSLYQIQAHTPTTTLHSPPHAHTHPHLHSAFRSSSSSNSWSSNHFLIDIHQWTTLTRGARIKDSTTGVVLAARTEGAAPNTILPSTQPFTIDPLPRPSASTTRSPPPSTRRPSLTRWSWVGCGVHC